MLENKASRLSIRGARMENFFQISGAPVVCTNLHIEFDRRDGGRRENNQMHLPRQSIGIEVFRWNVQVIPRIMFENRDRRLSIRETRDREFFTGAPCCLREFTCGICTREGE